MNHIFKKQQLWSDFKDRNEILQNCVGLLGNGSSYETMKIGKNQREVFKRSNNMENMLLRERDKVEEDYFNGANKYDGILYMIFTEGNVHRNRDSISSQVKPLYIGKAEKFGRGKVDKFGRKRNNLSYNIKSDAAFVRWGYGYEYHMGDLSAAILPGHNPKYIKKKYINWAKNMFATDRNNGEFKLDEYGLPRLIQPVYFWCTAWQSPSDDLPSRSIWQDIGKTRLAFEEYLLIGIASELFPKTLLNTEGHNRQIDLDNSPFW
tara:strand:- start:222 stop:1010 length:789 start_codon:yes stop_codon:yes gene_type:complete